MQETQAWFMGQEDPLEKEMATYSSLLAWRIPWTEEPGGLQSMELQRVGHGWATNTFTSLHWINTIQRSVIISTSGMWLTDLVNEPTMLGFSITKPFKCFFPSVQGSKKFESFIRHPVCTINIWSFYVQNNNSMFLCHWVNPFPYLYTYDFRLQSG